MFSVALPRSISSILSISGGHSLIDRMLIEGMFPLMLSAVLTSVAGLVVVSLVAYRVITRYRRRTR